MPATALGFQAPSLTGPGGYSKQATSANDALAAMAAQPHARGGEVGDDALTHAHAMLYQCVRSTGGQVERADGGKFDPGEGYVTGTSLWDHINKPKVEGKPLKLKVSHRTCAQILELWNRLEAENPHVPADRFSAMSVPGLAGIGIDIANVAVYVARSRIHDSRSVGILSGARDGSCRKKEVRQAEKHVAVFQPHRPPESHSRTPMIGPLEGK
jgi:hypothetical protein